MAEATPTSALVSKVDQFFVLLDKIKEAEERVDALKAQKTALELNIIDTLEDQGVTQLKSATGQTIFLTEPRIYASISKEKEKEAVAYLKRTWKLGYLFKEQYSSSALGRVVKERLTKGLPVPEEFVTYFAKKALGHRASKAGSGNEKPTA